MESLNDAMEFGKAAKRLVALRVRKIAEFAEGCVQLLG